MNKAKKVYNYITDSNYRFKVNNSFGLYRFMSDEKFLKRKFKVHLGYPLDLNNPQTFNEKLQWLKLHDRRPIYTTMVDKYEAKSFISERVGNEYVVPTLGIWDSFDEIDFSGLPEKFVLKTTHDSGGVIVCKNKATFDYKNAKKKLNKSLRTNFYYRSREWPYKNVKPRIMAEQFLRDERLDELRDYNFFTFDGVAKALYITSNRETDRRTDFFDISFNHLEIRDDDFNAVTPPAKPEKFEEMRKIAELLSKDIPQLRVDFYEVNGRAYLGELTVYYLGGYVPFEPKEWDKKFGDWIKLPDENGGGCLLINDGFVIHFSVIDNNTELRDYKFYTFNGEPCFFCINTNRGGDGGLNVNYFDTSFRELDFTWGFPHRNPAPSIPCRVDEMLDLSRKLSKGTNHLRVDLYQSEGKIFVGELTFFDGGGFEALVPDVWDLRFGKKIILPDI